jgi:hypothetical protein
MAHKSKRKHVKHTHEHPQAHHETIRAASFRELGSALVHRVYSRLMRRPRALMSRLTGEY